MYEKSYWVYILCSQRNGTLYIGVTNDIEKRVYEHKEKKIEGFTKKYNVTKLVYMEEYDDIDRAIEREKRLKHWNRLWKLRFIEEHNPEWEDLYETVFKSGKKEYV